MNLLQFAYASSLSINCTCISLSRTANNLLERFNAWEPRTQMHYDVFLGSAASTSSLVCAVQKENSRYQLASHAVQSIAIETGRLRSSRPAERAQGSKATEDVCSCPAASSRRATQRLRLNCLLPPMFEAWRYDMIGLHPAAPFVQKTTSNLQWDVGCSRAANPNTESRRSHPELLC